MRLFRIFLLLPFFASVLNLTAQNSLYHTLQFKPLFGNTILIPGEAYHKISTIDSLQIRTLKFYISNIELRNAGKTVWKEPYSYHLVNAAQESSLEILLSDDTAYNEFDEIRFCLGIDSVTNTSGAMGGSLDPTTGMYWTWQSGYINFKLEGICNLCVTRNNEFQFHLGGYQTPYNALQTIAYTPVQGPRTIFELDLKTFFENIHLSMVNQVMSPGMEAVMLSRQLASIFRVK